MTNPEERAGERLEKAAKEAVRDLSRMVLVETADLRLILSELEAVKGERDEALETLRLATEDTARRPWLSIVAKAAKRIDDLNGEADRCMAAVDEMAARVERAERERNFAVVDKQAAEAKATQLQAELEECRARVDRAVGAKTEALIERDGCHVNLSWWRQGIEYRARLYEPQLLSLSPALADVLALAVETPLSSLRFLEGKERAPSCTDIAACACGGTAGDAQCKSEEGQ